MKTDNRDLQRDPQYKNRIVIAITIGIIWIGLLPFFYDIFFSELYYMPFVGIIAATVANITPAAAGIVYFPILTQINVSPITVTQFSLMIQAYGMGLGTFRWFQMNRRLFILNILPICIVCGFAGELISMVWIPIENPELLTLFFNGVAFLFTQIIIFSLLRNKTYPNWRIELTESTIVILAMASVVGGLLCGWIGFGIDTLFYFILTIHFRIHPAIAIVTSISLMAAMSISGTIINWIYFDLPLALWFSAIPGVTLAGLFLATYIAVKIGSKNILLLFTFFLSLDFFMALWCQNFVPMGSVTKILVITPLALYMLVLHLKLFLRQTIGGDACAKEFHMVMGESEINPNHWKE